MVKAKIAICLATYNGEDYLQQQLISIQNQTNQEWKIFLRDDGSIDKTSEIIEEAKVKFGEKLVVIVDNESCGSSKANFIKIINYVLKNNAKDNINYFMFCDQDDVWLPDKIAVSLSKLMRLEISSSDSVPIAVHTDLKVVDSNLNLISSSFISYSKISPNSNHLNSVLVQNSVTGCTLMINLPLAILIQTIPDDAIMHDWWIAMVAACFGEIAFINKPTILYRQHGSNVVGAEKVNSIGYIFSKLTKISDIKVRISEEVLQASAFLKFFGHRIDNKEKNILQKFLLLSSSNKVTKLFIIFKYKFFKSTFLQNLGLIFFV